MTTIKTPTNFGSALTLNFENNSCEIFLDNGEKAAEYHNLDKHPEYISVDESAYSPKTKYSFPDYTTLPKVSDYNDIVDKLFTYVWTKGETCPPVDTAIRGVYVTMMIAQVKNFYPNMNKEEEHFLCRKFYSYDRLECSIMDTDWKEYNYLKVFVCEASSILKKKI